MKTFFTPAIAFLLGICMALPVFGQDAVEGNFTFMRSETAPGLSIVIQGQAKSVDEVIAAVFKDVANERGKSRKGMVVFENARFTTLSSEEYTYSFTIEAPSRRDDEHTRINMFIQDVNQDFVTSVNHPRTVAKAKNWLSDLEMETQVYEMTLVIEDQRKIVENAIKAHRDLIADSTSLQEDLVDLRQSISDNKEELARQREDVAEEGEQLRAFEAKLRALREERDIVREARRRAENTLQNGNN